MHAYLVLGFQKNKRDAMALKICAKRGIDRLDISVSFFEKTIGIEEIRAIQRQLMFKPLRSKEKAVIIPVDNGITHEAQNALLKTLEEPPANSIVILTSLTIELFLPTIISRCFIKKIHDYSHFSQTESSDATAILSHLPTMKIGEKLRLAQDIAKDKQAMLVWMERLILAERHALVQCAQDAKRGNSQIKSLYQTACSLYTAYKTIKSTNANPRLLIENLLISL